MAKEIWECSPTGELMDDFGNLIDENGSACGVCGEWIVENTSHLCVVEQDQTAENYEFNLKDVTEKLNRFGVEASFQMSGGGCATIYCGKPDPEGFYPVACGSAYWNWDEPNKSYGDTREFYIGKDGSEQGEDYFLYVGSNDPDRIANVIFNYFMDGLKNTDTCKHCLRFPATKGEFCECCTYKDEVNN